MSDPYDPATPTYRSPATPTWTDAANSASTSSDDSTAAYGAASDTSTGQASGTADVAKEQATQVKDSAVDASKNVAGTVKNEAANVASEAKSQAKNLLGETRSQLTEQAGDQQKRIASGLQSISDELHDMAGKSDSDGQGTSLVKQAATRAGDVASWLDARDPGSLLDDVSRFARQRPGTFIALAAVAGVLAGRFTRSLVSQAKDEKESNTSINSSTPSATHHSDTLGTTPLYSATTDNFDTAGDFVGSGDPTPNDAAYSAPEIDEPPLSVGNEPYRTPTTDQYGTDDRL